MHEQSIARKLLSMLDSICLERHLQNVTAVEIEVGVLSGIEPELLQSAFELLASDTQFAETELNLTVIPISGVCKECGNAQEVIDYDFRCESCGHPLNVTRGEGLEIASVTTDENAQQF